MPSSSPSKPVTREIWIVGLATLIARTLAPSTGSPDPQRVTVPVIVPVLVANEDSGYSSDSAAMSSASSERRSVPVIENGCMVGTWLSSSASSAPSLSTEKPTVECARPSVCPSSCTSVERRSKPARDPLIIRYMSSITEWPTSTMVSVSPKPLTEAGSSRSRRSALPVSSKITSYLPSPDRSPQAVSKLRLVKSTGLPVASTALVSVPHGFLAVVTLFHVAVASAISPETSVGPLSIVSGSGSCSQCEGGGPSSSDRYW